MAARGAVRARAMVLAVVMAVIGTAAVACVPAPEPGTSPVPGGRFESLEPGEGSVRLVGWAWDRDTPEPLLVDVLVNGSWFGPFRSDRERLDVGAPGRVAIGFDVTVPASVGSVTACVVARNVPDGPVSLLGCRSTEVRAVAGPSGGTTTTVPTSTTTSTSTTTTTSISVPTTTSTTSSTTTSSTTTSSTTTTTTTVPTTTSTSSTTTTSAVPTTTTTTVPSSGTVLSASVSVVSGTTDGLEVVVPGASVVTSVGAAVGDTSGLSVSASAAPSAPGSVAVRVGALSAPGGARTITFAVAGCATNPGGGACPSGDLVARTLDLRVTVTDPGPGVPDGFPLPAPEAWVARPDGTSVLPGHVDVFAAPPSPPADLAQLAAALGGAVVGARRDLGLYRVRVPDVAAALPLLRALSGVTGAEETVSEPPGEVDTTPDDYRALQLNPAQPGVVYHLSQVGLPAVWASAAPAPRRTVGIIDTGFYEFHPDLLPNTATVDMLLPGHNVFDRRDAWLASDHGTHVGGIMCGADGNGGAVGVDPDCRLRVLDLGVSPASDADRVAGIDAWLDERPDVRLVNISLVIGGVHDTNGCKRAIPAGLRAAWDAAVARHPDVLFVVAAGNCGAEGRGVRDALPQALSLTRPNVIAVSATDDVDTSGGLNLASFSARDGQVAAPGVLVQSSIHDPTDCAFRPAGTVGGFLLPDGTVVACAVPATSPTGIPGVVRKSGTSMAAPLVTGIASLVLDAHPTFTAAQVKQCLLAGATSDVTNITGSDGSVDPAVNEIDAVLAVRCGPGYERQPNGPDGRKIEGYAFPSPGATSADGRFVLVNPTAANAVAGDTSTLAKLLVWDRRTRSYRAQPPGVDGRRPNGESRGMSISADGSKVAFRSPASNLVAGDTNGFSDAFVWDLRSDTYRRAPVNTEADVPLDDANRLVLPRISADGRWVMVNRKATKPVNFGVVIPVLVTDVVVWDLTDDSVIPMPAGTDGFASGSANGQDISGDGSSVLIRDRTSGPSNLTAGDLEGPDLYLWTPGSMTYRRWPRTVPSSSRSPEAFLSADGSTVVANTNARLLPSDTDDQVEPYIWRTATGEFVRAPAALDGSRPTLTPLGISGDGGSVLLLAFSTGLVPGRGAVNRQIVVWDVASGTYDQQPLGFDGAEPLADVVGGQPNAGSGTGAISADGLVVALGSSASNLTRDCGCAPPPLGSSATTSQIYVWTGRATP